MGTNYTISLLIRGIGEGKDFLFGLLNLYQQEHAHIAHLNIPRIHIVMKIILAQSQHKNATHCQIILLYRVIYAIMRFIKGQQSPL